MVRVLIALVAILALVGMSVRANRRFKDHARLPMQWSLHGTVTWTAPRAIALSFTPVLAATALLIISVLNGMLKPRPGQEHLLSPAFLFVALVFIGAHAFHLALIRKSLGRGDRGEHGGGH